MYPRNIFCRGCLWNIATSHYHRQDVVEMHRLRQTGDASYRFCPFANTWCSFVVRNPKKMKSSNVFKLYYFKFLYCEKYMIYKFHSGVIWKHPFHFIKVWPLHLPYKQCDNKHVGKLVINVRMFFQRNESEIL